MNIGGAQVFTLHFLRLKNMFLTFGFNLLHLKVNKHSFSFILKLHYRYDMVLRLISSAQVKIK